MKRRVAVVSVALVLPVMMAVGCSNRALDGASTGPAQEAVSSCINCHTDKDTLKQVASPAEEEVVSEATSGEG